MTEKAYMPHPYIVRQDSKAIGGVSGFVRGFWRDVFSHTTSAIHLRRLEEKLSSATVIVLERSGERR